MACWVFFCSIAKLIINLFVICPEGGKESGQHELISQNGFTVKAWISVRFQRKVQRTNKVTHWHTHAYGRSPLHSVMPEPASVCRSGVLTVVKAGTRPPGGKIQPLKTMTVRWIQGKQNLKALPVQATTWSTRQGCGGGAVWAWFANHMFDMFALPRLLAVLFSSQEW